MMRDALFAAAAVLGSISCLGAAETKKESAKAPAAQAGELRELPARMTVRQRSTVAVPGSDGRLELTIDDITRGQVMTSLVHTKQGLLIPQTSLREGASKTFELGSTTYRLRLKKLHNALIGTDLAEFVVIRELSEGEKIDKLIAMIEKEDAVTYRRGKKEYTAKKEAAYLRKCREEFGDKIATADEFVGRVLEKDGGRDHVVEFPNTENHLSDLPMSIFLKLALESIENGEAE
jgi:hypothetical protein